MWKEAVIMNVGANQVVEALNVIYSPKSNNGQRLEAQKFLDSVRTLEESPLWGFEIALNNSDNNILKYFGLNLLEYNIKKNWNSYNNEKRQQLKKWIIELNYNVSTVDTRYIKEKLASLWVEIAKRIWGEALKETNPSNDQLLDSWVDLDRDLHQLWNINESSREVTLIIFRILFEDVFLLDDMTVLKRMTIIQPLCVMIVCPMDIFITKYKFSEKWTLFKADSDGWFSIWIPELRTALLNKNSEYIIRLLETLKTCLNWPLSEVIIKNDILTTLLDCLATDIRKAQSMALDSIHILLTRPYGNDEHYQTIIDKVFDSMDLLARVYEDLLFNPEEEVDETRYPIVKKFVDMTSCLYVSIPKIKDTNNQIEKYFKLVMQTTYNPSLIVSGLTLDLWCSCLRNDDYIPLIQKYAIKDLLNFAADALVYYEQIDGHISRNYVDIDFQSNSEFQSYCSTYRKRIRDIIRLISCVEIDMTYEWLNNRLNVYFSSPAGQQVLTSSFLDHKSEPYLGALSQYMIVECFINGCIRWKIWYPSGPDYNQKLDSILQKLEILSNQLIALNMKEPLLLKKQIQNFALFLTMLRDNVLFTLLEKIITSATMDYPEVNLDDRSEQSDAVRDLRYACGIELNRMALLMPESLKSIYPDLEAVIAKIMPNLSYHEKISFKSFLLIIVLKSSLDNKEQRFSELVDVELMAWSEKTTEVGLSDLHWFMERLGIVQIAEYFQKRGINENSDLLTIPIDDEGRALKAELTKRWQTLFPVRATRMFIHYSMQSIKGDEEFKRLQDLWRPRIIPVLPYILRLLFQLQSYHDAENWKNLPVIVQTFVKCTTVERFWEAGASSKSKDEFIDEHMKAMQTLRDFADSVGHIIRYTREYTLLVLSAISSLGSIFFELDDVPDMLINSIAIFKPGNNEISPGVSTHGWKHILNIAIRPMLKNCPDDCAPKFMSAFLPKLFEMLDHLLYQRWSVRMDVMDVNPAPVDNDQMTEDILEENLLRQLTTVVVRIVIDCVGQASVSSQSARSNLTSHQLRMRKIIFNDINILAPFLKLVNHLMAYKDNKCSFNSILVMKGCINEVAAKDETVDVFFTTELMKNLLINVLCNSAFKDFFNEALYVFTTLFLTLCKESTSARQFFYELSGGYDIDSLHSNLKKVDDYKSQRALMVEFIDWTKMTLGKDDFDEEQAMQENRKQEKREAILQKANERLIKKNKESGDMLDDPNTEDGAVGNLFS